LLAPLIDFGLFAFILNGFSGISNRRINGYINDQSDRNQKSWGNV
jgi:hypothetical protein